MRDYIAVQVQEVELLLSNMGLRSIRSHSRTSRSVYLDAWSTSGRSARIRVSDHPPRLWTSCVLHVGIFDEADALDARGIEAHLKRLLT